MFRNIWYNKRQSQIHLWHTINGERIDNNIIPWVPYVFILDKHGNEKYIDGRNVSKLTFRNFYDYYKFCKEPSISEFFENNVSPEIQFLCEYYGLIEDDKIDQPNLKIHVIDIEVETPPNSEFPDPNFAKHPICLISIYDSMNDKMTTFGVREYTGDAQYLDEYIYCKNEKILLNKFLNFTESNYPDVYTGWNIKNFDLLYIINRLISVIGEGSQHRLSPVNAVSVWDSKKVEKQATGRYIDRIEKNIDIAGVTYIDYLAAYKHYQQKTKLENYSLQTVSMFELEKGKLDISEYKDMREIIDKNWNMFVDYNNIDVKRVWQIEEKKKFIRSNIQFSSLLTRTPMRSYDSQTQMLEGAALTYFRRNKLCAPKHEGGSKQPFQGADVKETIPGFYDWVIDLDIQSSYPSHVISSNMSLETYFGRIIDLSEKEIIECCKNNEFKPFLLHKKTETKKIDGDSLKSFNKIFSGGLLSVSPCGSIFRLDKPGVIAELQRYHFNSRVKIKNKMKNMSKTLNTITNNEEKEKIENEINRLDYLQIGLKILLNSTYGATSVPYSRYFNLNISEAITSCGRYTVSSCWRFINEFFNNGEYKKFKSIEKYDYDKDFKFNEDWVVAADTDSSFIKLGFFFSTIIKNWNDINDDEKIKIIKNFSYELQTYINDRVYNEIQVDVYKSREKTIKINFKQEVIAKTGLFVATKKYVLWCIDQEGIPKDEEIIKGLEVIQSSTPRIIRSELKSILRDILRKIDDKELKTNIENVKKMIKNGHPDEISQNININDMNKFIDENFQLKQVFNKNGKNQGPTPQYRGIVNYYKLLNILNLRYKYPEIMNNNKAKVVFIKQPNMFNVDVISYINWPKEFTENGIFIDTNKMTEKTFIKKLDLILRPMHKEFILTDESTLLDLIF